ncbi:leucine-rich repeat and death domain-containing protein 1 [Schistocerca gregaria]|uniref:Leucine-rich repeat protein SHOC-2 n=1 Tax=Schistocerca gregaria TaxID=7010 RepID=A0A8E5NJE2_SCHGR|nr:leucine-rich repeat and death domain-containing protein 1 [Schistocerca gregaria]QVD39591.1 Leucine-rich repeat protein SHOC-2 [Schistocerca gregaria]
MLGTATVMSTFLYTLLGLTVGSSLHCAVRREISPCSCRQRDGSLQVACERMASFAQVRDAVAGKFAPEQRVTLRIAYSSLPDLGQHRFDELGFTVTSLKLNHDNLSLLNDEAFNGLEWVEFLSLADNALPEIPQYVLKRMPHVKTLDMGRSKISTVLENDFKSVPELQHLFLPGNMISKLEKNCIPYILRHLHIGRNRIESLNGSLRHLNDLEWLFLNQNQLVSLEDELPPDGAKLILLHVSDNKLQKLPQDLRKYIYLESLFVSKNEIQSFNGTLQKLRKLKRLHADHNKIKELSSDEFMDLENMEDLQLGHNCLSVLNGSLLPLRSLRCVNLTHNLFENMTLREITGLRNLRVIDLSHNQIRHLSSGPMTQNLVELETRVAELRLEYNLLTALDGSLMGLHGLQKLNISHNLIETISPDDLINLDELKVLDISFNRLTTLEETSKTVLPALEFLYVSNNLLTALEKDFHGLPVLCWADLSHNQIQTVGQDLIAHTRCRRFGVYDTLRIYVDGNPIVCGSELEQAVAAIEAHYAKIHGVLECTTTNLTTVAVTIIE